MSKHEHKRKYRTAAEEEFLRAHYADTPTKELAEQLGRTGRMIYNRADRMGLSKPAHGFPKGSTSGAAYRFRKGNVPAKREFEKGQEAASRRVMRRIMAT
jgi:hypothetical protein